MNGPRINNDERGFTINKSLAWTMAVGLVAGGLWLGRELTATSAALQAMSAAQKTEAAEQAQYQRDMDARVRVLEQDRTAAIGELTSLRRDLTEFRVEMRTDLQAISTVLQQLYRNGSPVQ